LDDILKHYVLFLVFGAGVVGFAGGRGTDCKVDLDSDGVGDDKADLDG
jgi:hypothetical protein